MTFYNNNKQDAHQQFVEEKKDLLDRQKQMEKCSKKQFGSECRWKKTTSEFTFFLGFSVCLKLLEISDHSVSTSDWKKQNTVFVHLDKHWNPFSKKILCLIVMFFFGKQQQSLWQGMKLFLRKIIGRFQKNKMRQISRTPNSMSSLFSVLSLFLGRHKI